MRSPRDGMPALMRTPRGMDVEITSRCNLRCRYCYFFDNPAEENVDLPTAEWVRFFEELGDCAVMNVCLSGGEPFLRPDLPELLESIVANRMRFTILSNGALIDDSIAMLLANSNRCNHVQISVDGSGPSAHDACRGAGAFDGAVRGIRTLQRHGVPVAVRLTIHRYNVHDLEAAARFLLEELGLPRFSTNSAGYVGACQRGGADLLLGPSQRVLAMKTVQRLAARYPGRIQADAGPLADASSWQRMEAARASNTEAFASGGRLTGCGCAFSKLAVRPDGICIPCLMLPHVELGRINRDSLSALWRDAEPLNRLRTRSRISLSEFDYCDGCAYIPYCTGNCPGMAYALVGEVDHPSPDACLRDFLRDGGEIPSALSARGSTWEAMNGSSAT